jgi:hypothetical protein
MEAYAELLSSAAKMVDEFADEPKNDDAARDHLADNHGDVSRKQISGDSPNLAEARHRAIAAMLMKGINRIIAQEGEIKAKFMCDVDASESSKDQEPNRQ